MRDAFDGTRPVPHEHGLQARLPGVAAAGDRRRAARSSWAGGWLRRARGCGSRGRIAALVLLLLGARLPVRGHLRAQGRLRRRAARSTACAGCRRRAPGDPAAIDWLARPRAARLGRARGGRRRLLGVRPRADLDLHRPPDRDRLGRPRAPVGARPRRAPRRTSRRSTARPTSTRRSRCSTRYGVHYVVVGPLERTTYGDAGVAKWDQLGQRVFDRDGTTVWELR